MNAYILHQLAHWDEYGYGHWAVNASEDGRVVGWNGLGFLPGLGETEVAYLLSGRVWGRGYATEATHASSQFGFETVGLERIIGLGHPGNGGLIRALEKCGLSLVDRITLWELEMCRYQIDRSASEAFSR